MEKGLGLDDSEDLAPIAPVTEPDQRKAGRRGGTSWRLLAFLVEGELLTKKEILRSQRGAGTQAETKETQAVVEEGQQDARELKKGAKQVCGSRQHHMSLSRLNHRLPRGQTNLA
jgi:hypothetical protein